MLLLVYTVYIGALFTALRSKDDFMIIIDSDNVYSNFVYMDNEFDRYNEYDDYYNHDRYEYFISLYNREEQSDMIYKEKSYNKFLHNPTLIVPCKNCYDTNKINNNNNNNNARSKEVVSYQIMVSNAENMRKDKQMVDCTSNIDYSPHNDCNKPSKKLMNTKDDQLRIIIALFCFLFGFSCSKVLELCVQKYNMYIKESTDKRLQSIETDAIILINNGNYIEAFDLLQLAIDIIITYKGKLHIDYGTFNHLLAKTMRNLGQLKSAETILIDVIKMYEPYGEDVHMIEALDDLGIVLTLQGRIDESVLIFSKVNEIMESTKRTTNYLASEEFNINDMHTKYGIPQNQSASDDCQHCKEDTNQGNICSNEINYYVASDDISNNFMSDNVDNTMLKKHSVAIDTESFKTPFVNNLLTVDGVETKKKLSISPETIMFEFENI